MISEIKNICRFTFDIIKFGLLPCLVVLGILYSFIVFLAWATGC